mgnify:CR=1 FL=1
MPKTILVADDKANIRNRVRDHLEADGVRIPLRNRSLNCTGAGFVLRVMEMGVSFSLPSRYLSTCRRVYQYFCLPAHSVNKGKCPKE